MQSARWPNVLIAFIFPIEENILPLKSSRFFINDQRNYLQKWISSVAASGVDDGWPLPKHDGCQWSIVNRQSSMVNRQWSIVNRQWSIPNLPTPVPNFSHSSLFFWTGLLHFQFCIHMALLDLDKIIIKRTIVGIRCTSCGGSLEVAKSRSVAGRFIKLVSFGTIKPRYYECENCKKRHLLI